MSIKTLSVIGGGQMGRALVGGMIASGLIKPAEIQLVEPSEESQRWWRAEYAGINIVELHQAVEKGDCILIAVKPNVVGKVIEQAKSRQPDCWQRKLVISIAAGITLKTLCRLIGHEGVVRVMPNTPCLVREGVSAYCGGPDVTAEQKANVDEMLQSVGLAVEVAENQMDGVTGLSGSGPAYVCLIAEALADGGVLNGLPRDLAIRLATQTLLGTARMIAETERHPATLKDAVASPGGTTIAGLAALEQNGVRGALIQAVTASAQRSRELR